MKYKFIILLITAGLTGLAFMTNEANSNIQTLTLIGTQWASTSEHPEHFTGDSLRFVTSSDVEYFMGGYNWIFDSKYVLQNDTLKIQIISAAFEVDDTSILEPDIIQSFILRDDSLKLVKLKYLENGKWTTSDPKQFTSFMNFYRVN